MSSVANNGLICSEQLKKPLSKNIVSHSANKIMLTDDSVFATVSDFNDFLDQTSITVVNHWKRIVMVDYAFSTDDSVDRLEEFQLLQDKMVSHGLSKVILNLITTDSTLYSLIKKSNDQKGIPGLLYPNAEVFLLDKSITVNYIVATYNGLYDGQGLISERKIHLTRLEKAEQDKKRLEEEISQVPDHILEYEKDLPANELSRQDFLGTHKAEKKQEQYWAEIENTQNETEETKEPETENDNETVQKPNLKKEKTFLENKKEARVQVKGFQYSENKDVAQLEYLYRKLTNNTTFANSQKLATDQGKTILFSGMAHSGVSGLVAQAAEVYASVGLKVCVLDLDILERMQTVYFSNFDEKISLGSGLSNGLLNVMSGGRVDQASVEVTSKINVCSISRKLTAPVTENEMKTIAYNIEPVLQDALTVAKFDIVLIDCPFKYLEQYMELLNIVDRFILTVEAKDYKLNYFLNYEIKNLIEDNQLLLQDILDKTSLVINKKVPNSMDQKGILMNKKYVKEKILNLGTPYDKIYVVGDIPFYDDWEDQFITNKRYVWSDDIYMEMVKQILQEAV